VYEEHHRTSNGVADVEHGELTPDGLQIVGEERIVGWPSARTHAHEKRI
jgi:hypothetical protein